MVRSLFHLSLRLNRSLSLWRLIVRRFLEGDIAQHGHSSAGHTILRRGGILGLEQDAGAQAADGLLQIIAKI